MGGCCTSMKEAELAHAHDFALAVKKKHAEDELLRIKNAHDKGMGLEAQVQRIKEEAHGKQLETSTGTRSAQVAGAEERVASDATTISTCSERSQRTNVAGEELSTPHQAVQATGVTVG
ncbi:hypothetical protein T484DRAFT_1920607, partial [Baffinella frigidus]